MGQLPTGDLIPALEKVQGEAQGKEDMWKAQLEVSLVPVKSCSCHAVSGAPERVGEGLGCLAFRAHLRQVPCAAPPGSGGIPSHRVAPLGPKGWH